jgi:GTP-binding protein
MKINFNNAAFYRSYGTYSQLSPSDRPEIAFSGRSNVGKSSLINRILGRKSLARTSSMPGKTATINFYSLDSLYLVDLPGYGYAKRAKSDMLRWSELIEGYIHDKRELVLFFQLIDMRHAPSEDDIMMINFLIDNEIPFVIIFTKADKLKKSEREERMKGFAAEIPCFEDTTYVVFSAQTGEGTEEIRGIIEECIDQ